MNYKLYNENNPIRTVSGQLLSAADLKQRRFFAPLFNGGRHLLLVDGAGVVQTFASLDKVAADLGVTLDESMSDEAVEAAINEANLAKREKARAVTAERNAKKATERVTLEAVQAENAELKARIETQDEAILELASIVAGMGV